MQDVNCFRNRLEPLNPISKVRVTVDQRRSGQAGRDGYTVLDQARLGARSDDWGYPMTPQRGRAGLTERVTDGPRYSDDY